MWPSTSCPLSSLTRNIVLGRASVISPSISIFSSLAMRRGAYLTAQVFDSAPAVSYFPCILRRLQLGQGRAQLGTGLDPQLGRQLVASQQRRRRTLAAPVKRGGDHLPGELEVGADHLRAGDRSFAASREAVGDGQQGDVNGDRFGRAQVGVDAARRERHLRGQEDEPQGGEGPPPQGVRGGGGGGGGGAGPGGGLPPP